MFCLFAFEAPPSTNHPCVTVRFLCRAYSIRAVWELSEDRQTDQKLILSYLKDKLNKKNILKGKEGKKQLSILSYTLPI